MKAHCPPLIPAPAAIPGTFAIGTVDGPVTRVESFPQVVFHAPIGAPVSCDMRAAVTSIVPNPEGGWLVLGVVDLGGVVLTQPELAALPGYSDFFAALLQAGLAKLNAPPVEEEIQN